MMTLLCFVVMEYTQLNNVTERLDLLGALHTLKAVTATGIKETHKAGNPLSKLFSRVTILV